MLATFVFIFVTILVKQAACQSVPFRDDYTYDEATQAFYKENKVGRRWEGAVLICAAQGAQLAIPSSDDDKQAIIRHMGTSTDSVWLGVHDPMSTGDFFTLNETRIELKLKTNQDNPTGGKENCVAMSKNGDYNATDCNTRRKFICSKNSDSVTRNNKCETYDMDYTYSVVADRCYKVHTTPKVWFTAMKICIMEGSNLAVLNSAYESEIIIKILKEYPEKALEGKFDKRIVHLGFKEFKKGGGFNTLDGKPLVQCGYVEWASNQPSKGRKAKACGGMLRNGKLTSVDCRQKAIFICEKFLEQEIIPSFDLRFGEEP